MVDKKSHWSLALLTSLNLPYCMQAQAEVSALNTFNELLVTEPARAFYGFKHVSMANERLAIETLLLSDSLFRSTDIQMRKKYVDLVDSVKSQVRDISININSALRRASLQLFFAQI